MATPVYKPKYPVRFVTASSLFDGHDASINIMRRILQASGAEVIHLGHNRSVEEIVQAAIEEDVQGIGVSSYQGGHMEFFKYMIDLLREKNASHIRVYGGGGGVIIPREIHELEAYGVAKIFSPEDGRRLGLQGMINHMLQECDFPTITNGGDAPVVQTESSIAVAAGTKILVDPVAKVEQGDPQAIGRLITVAEFATDPELKPLIPPEYMAALQEVKEKAKTVPVIGITGTGGSGKSSLTDELVRRFLNEIPEIRIAILSVDPTRQKSGGALLGDRIRMNAINTPRVYMRSLATRQSNSELSLAIHDALAIVKAADFDLIIVETSGIGQGDAEITKISDISLYVMTAEFGAPSQLEKIDMIGYADLIAINKFEKVGSEDARRLVQKQYQREHLLFDRSYEEMPVFGTMASQFNDPGTNALFSALIQKLNETFHLNWSTKYSIEEKPVKKNLIIPNNRRHYLLEIVETIRDYHNKVEEQLEIGRQLYQIEGTLKKARKENLPEEVIQSLEQLREETEKRLTPESRNILRNWKQLKEAYRKDTFSVKVRNREITIETKTKTLSGLEIPKVALPKFKDYGEILRWVYKENVPGSFPFTAGVFPFKRKGEDPKRQFAGEGTPERTNRRFHYLSKDDKAKRLSTAFDSVTLYGEDPDERPDIYGKIGESGVSVCTLDDMKKLYKGFDLCDPHTSVSMTINGPAPIILAMFMNTAIDQQVEKREKELGRPLTKEEYEEVKAYTLQTVRGTVQADILKEDQGQNTCIFNTEFALRMMGDIQQYFIDHNVRNYYSVSISGYHIAEAGANPITQLAFTLANGFTYVEYYLSRGMHIDDFAPNLSFFFSNGLDPEYTVLGRVARRIWAIAMREKYGANERSQKLKYHIQTSKSCYAALQRI